MAKRWARLDRACEILGIGGKSTLYDGIKKGIYPRPAKVGPAGKISAWDEAELQATADRSLAARDQVAA
jgi:predicted DNA-binding transcriptional regulator AlpA